MQLHRLASIAATVSALGMTTFAAQATIVNIDAKQDFTTSLTLDAGSYDIQVVGIAGGGLYDAWTYKSGSGYRDAYTITAGAAALTIDYDNGTPTFENSSTAAGALAKASTGPYSVYIGKTDGTDPSYGYAYIVLGLDATTTLTFGVPDNNVSDNTGGVSLSVTSAVPEPESYALMLAGLGALGFVARRRRAA